jgi:glutathione synthase/RimK-type ligase-like ATP-grasp enzyme
MKRVVLVTGIEHYDAVTQTSREPDDVLLRQSLLAKGIDVQVAVWNDPLVDWEQTAHEAVVVIRSCWDYHNDRKGFLAWAQRIAEMTTLLNPIKVLRWNTHKHYLQGLQQEGIPIIPTIWLRRGPSPVLADLLAERGWMPAVIKPAVSTNGYASLLVDRTSLANGQAQAHLDHWMAEREMMIQPFLPTVTGIGEHSLVFIAGTFTHAFRKRAVLCGEADASGEQLTSATEREVDLAQQILRSAATLLGISSLSPFLFARVDLIHDAGTLRLMELELVEPRLRLADAPEARECLAAAIAAHCPGTHALDLPLAA